MSDLRTTVANCAARTLRCAPGELSHDVPLTSYGLDSVKAIELCGDLEALLGRELDPRVVWEHPTVDRLADHLRG